MSAWGLAASGSRRRLDALPDLPITVKGHHSHRVPGRLSSVVVKIRGPPTHTTRPIVCQSQGPAPVRRAIIFWPSYVSTFIFDDNDRFYMGAPRVAGIHQSVTGGLAALPAEATAGAGWGTGGGWIYEYALIDPQCGKYAHLATSLRCRTWSEVRNWKEPCTTSPKWPVSVASSRQIPSRVLDPGFGRGAARRYIRKGDVCTARFFQQSENRWVCLELGGRGPKQKKPNTAGNAQRDTSKNLDDFRTVTVGLLV